MNWNDITLNQYLEIESVTKTESDLIDKSLSYIKIIFNIDNEHCKNLPYNDYLEYVKKLDFLGNEIPMRDVKEVMKDHSEYYIYYDLSNLSVAQYIDFNNYREMNDLIGIVSTVFIPKDKEYCKDYDMSKVKTYIGEMKIGDVLSIFNFFLRYFNSYMDYSRLFLQKKMKKLKKSIRKKRLTRLQMFRLYYRLLRKRISHTIRLWKWQLQKFFIFFHI